jgi:fructoselysine-6-P-deglycase FrlB-like protein
MLITLLSGDATRRVEGEFIEEMKDLGGKLFVICDKAEPALAGAADYLFDVGSGLPDFARSILQILPVHFLAYYKSLAVCLSPAEPVNLTYWVETISL